MAKRKAAKTTTSMVRRQDAAPPQALEARVLRDDGYENFVNGIGVAGTDKAMGGTFRLEVLSDEFAEVLWRGNDLAARIVEAEPEEMLRQGYEFVPTMDGEDADIKAKEVAGLVMAKVSDLKFDERLRVGMQNERAKGGGAILLAALDGATNLEEPLNEERLVDIAALNFIPRGQMWPKVWQDDPMLPGYNEVLVWNVVPRRGMLTGTGVARSIHASRMLVFPGIRVSDEQVMANGGHGDSVLNRVYRILRGFDSAFAGVEHLLSEFSLDMLKIKGLSELIARNKPEAVRERARQMRAGKTIAGMLILDASEEYSRQSVSMASLPDVMDRLANRLAAAADMPVSLLMGQAPAGLNATGQADIQFYYDRVAARQRTRLLPHINRLIRLLLRSKSGPTGGVEPEKWEIKFRPLYQMTELQLAELRNKQMLTDQGYVAMGAVTNNEVAVSRFSGEYSTETVVDFDAREKMAEANAGEEPPVKPTPATPAPGDDATPDDGKGGNGTPTKAGAKGDKSRK